MHARPVVLAIVAALSLGAGPGRAAEASLPPAASILEWTPDQQAVGYRSIDKIAPVRIIRRGDHVRALPIARHSIGPRWTWNGQPMTVERYMTSMRTSGVVVLKDGRIVLERYGLGRTAKDRWTSFSVAKSVTSILIGAAIQDGKIKSLDAPVTDTIHELKGSAYDGVSVRQLLTMTSGVKWNEDYSDPHSDVAQAGTSVLEPGVNPIVSYMRRLPRADPPGSKFVYKTGETDLAGVLLTDAVGETMADYLSEKIWRPYGMDQDAAWLLDPSGHERGGCCISMTLRDYARIGQFMLEGGRAGDVQVVPRGYVEESTSRRVTFPPGQAVDRGYGYFWWIHDRGYAAAGIFGQEIFIFPEDRVVVAVNSAWLHADRDEDWAAQAAFAEALRAAAVRARN